MGDLQRLERRIEGELGDLGRQSLSARDEIRMIFADVGRRRLRRCARSHVDRALAFRVDEDLGQGARAAREIEARLDARLLHGSAEGPTRVVVGLTAEEADPGAEECGPAQLI